MARGCDPFGDDLPGLEMDHRRQDPEVLGGRAGGRRPVAENLHGDGLQPLARPRHRVRWRPEFRDVVERDVGVRPAPQGLEPAIPGDDAAFARGPGPRLRPRARHLVRRRDRLQASHDFPD